ncbi:MAG: hypothetical protein AAF936_17905 [Pseudomonadota bacterium]
MRSLQIRAFLIFAGCVLLTGCLVSEEPVLDASNGRARPLGEGLHLMCPVNDEADECQSMTVERDATGLYSFVSESEAPTSMRFRRIGRHGYAAQSQEDDGYAYYYGAGDARRFRLIMMMCSDLQAALRMRLIERGDLETQDDNFETCIVKSRNGLTAAAKAYHRGEVENEEEIAFVLTPEPDNE